MSSAKPENQCILCGSNRIRIKDSVSTDQVVEGYATASNVNVKSYFNPGNTMDLIDCENCGLISNNPMPAGNASFYEDLQRLRWYYQGIKPEYHFAKTHIHEKDRVLEIGCVKGVFQSFLSESLERGTQLGSPIGLKGQMLCSFKQMMRVWVLHLDTYMCSSKAKLG